MESIKQSVIVVLLLAIFAVQSLFAITTKSATFDEVGYFGLGKYLLTHQSWDVPGSILHPPLSYYLNSIPLMFVSMDDHPWDYSDYAPEFRWGDRKSELLGTQDIIRGQALLSSPENTDDRLLILSRMMTLILALIMGWYVYRFSHELYGPRGGLLSLVLFTFCPNMIAFSGLIVPDLPQAAFFLITIYYFHKNLNDNNLSSCIASGVFLGLALLCKYTALLLLPITLLLYVLCNTRNKDKQFFLPFIYLVAFLVLLIGYGFNLSPYITGNLFQWDHAKAGHLAFLMGEVKAGGWWYYYLVAFLFKTPVPMMLMSLAALLISLRNAKKSLSNILFLLVPVAAVLIFFSINHQSIGIRYILPIYPFLFVLAGSCTVCRPKAKILITVGLIWYISGTISTMPHYLAYFNELVGGPANGYKYLVDSNLDWGQDLKLLKEYMDNNGIRRISLSYFGGDTPKHYGIQFDDVNVEPNSMATKKAILQSPNRLIAISTTHLQGVYLQPTDMFLWLLKYQPVAKIGYSIFVYDLDSIREKEKYF